MYSSTHSQPRHFIVSG